MATSRNTSIAVSFVDNQSLDAAGRLRTSDPLILGEYSNAEVKNTDLFNFVGTGTQTYEDLTDGVVGVKMAVTAGQYCIAETKYSHPYTKGHSQKFTQTTLNFQKEAGLIKRIGYYSSSVVSPYNTEYDGMHIESDGDSDDYFLCFTRKGTVVLRHPRASWDDPLDGTGPSKLTIDWSVFDIADCDFLWLGGKGGRFSFMVDNTCVEAYNYGHAGNAGTTGLIMRSPNQPLRWEIRSTTGIGYMYCICGDVVSEGGNEGIGLGRNIPTMGNIQANSIGVKYLMIAFRLKASRRNSVISLSDFNLIGVTNDSFISQLIVNPVIAGAALVWQDYSPTSALEYAIGDLSNPSTNTITGGDSITGVSGKSGTNVANGGQANSFNRLTRNVDGTNDIFAFVVSPLTVNLDANGNVNALEKIL